VFLFMAKLYDRQIVIKGTQKERRLFTDLIQHYEMATEDNETRWADWDSKYELFRSYTDESNWPYNSMVFVPQTFTALFEKMARSNGGKPRGRLIPRDGKSDVIGAKINNELLSFQWDEVARREKDSMVRKWSLMDLQTRIYGSSFAITKWVYETDSKGEIRFDGPTMKVLHPKDSLPNPSYSKVKNWFQYREFVTIDELERINDVSGKKPRYKNLDLLKKSVQDKSRGGGDTRDVNYGLRGKEISGVQDYLGRDETKGYETIELITELRDEKKYVFAPRHGVVLQDEDNPYDHDQIPVVHLNYIAIDDDIWGLSEIEPVEKIQRTINALTSQYVDATNMDLYRILKVKTTGVQMHTLEWGPGKIWKMNDPADVIPLEHSAIASGQFVNVYSVLISMFKEAMGETSAAFSSLQPFGTEKTATEVQEGQITRSVRDNFNQVFLGESIEAQMMFWFLMNKQFIFSDPEKSELPLRIVGREALQEFKNLGLDQKELAASEEEVMAAAIDIEEGLEPELLEIPKFPVSTADGTVPKFELDDSGEFGTLLITPEDMTGNYDYIADVEPMSAHSSLQERQTKREAFTLLANPVVVQLLQAEGKRVKVSEVITDLFDSLGMKNADKYFEVVEGESDVQEQGNANAGGEQIGGPGGGPPINEGIPGMAGGGQVAQGSGIPQLG
jgi:hypothetical protein